MKRTVCASLLLSLCLTVGAAERSNEEMVSIAVNQLFGASARGMQGAADVQCVSANDAFGIYSNADGGGFVVVSRDDAFAPVLGYSSSSYDPERLPDGLRWWLGRVEQSLKQRKATGNAVASVPYTVVDNMVESKWGQAAPFNYLCPTVGSVQTPTGCVATAMAQLMFFFKYPANSVGYGKHSVGDYDNTVKDTLGASYEWDKLLAVYSKPIYTAAVKKRIGQLLFDCGAASNMLYTSAGSGTTTFEAAVGLYHNFQYDSLAIQHYMRYFYTDTEWMTIVYEELAAGRPIIYGGVDNTYGGHAFLLTGVDESGKVYANWGWNGVGDGYYDLSVLAPTGILGYSGTMNFSSDETMITGLKPQKEPDAGEEIIPQIHNYYANYTLRSNAYNRVKVTLNAAFNVGLLPFEGEINLFLFDDDNPQNSYEFKAYSTDKNIKIIKGGNDVVEASSTNIDVTELPVGTWAAYLGSRQKGGTRVTPVRGYGGTYFYTIKKAESGSITITSRGIQEVTMGVEQPVVVEPTAVKTTNGIYDLSGRRLKAKPAQGAYIMDGKKYLSK